jgi:hypothetical protein
MNEIAQEGEKEVMDGEKGRNANLRGACGAECCRWAVEGEGVPRVQFV